MNILLTYRLLMKLILNHLNNDIVILKIGATFVAPPQKSGGRRSGPSNLGGNEPGSHISLFSK